MNYIATNNNFLEELKNYFETTSRDKVLEDWEKSKASDDVGLTVEEFLEIQKSHVEEK